MPRLRRDIITRVSEATAAAALAPVPVLVHVPVEDVRAAVRRTHINQKRKKTEYRRIMVFFKHFSLENTKKHAFLSAILSGEIVPAKKRKALCLPLFALL